MKESKKPMHDNSDTMADSTNSSPNSIYTTQEESNNIYPKRKMDPVMPNMKMGDMDMKEMKMPMHDNSDTMADSNKSMSNSINTTQEEANKMDPNMKMDPAMPNMKMGDMDMTMRMMHMRAKDGNGADEDKSSSHSSRYTTEQTNKMSPR